MPVRVTLKRWLGTAHRPLSTVTENGNPQMDKRVSALKRLSKKYRVILYLHYCEELSTDQIAGITGAYANSILKDGLYYILFDQNGTPLTADYYIGMEGGETEPLSDGRRVWNILHSGNPIPENVKQITFVPKGTLERIETESSNDYFLRIWENADEKACFTVDLTDQ